MRDSHSGSGHQFPYRPSIDTIALSRHFTTRRGEETTRTSTLNLKTRQPIIATSARTISGLRFCGALGALDGRADQPLGLRGIAPSLHLHPLSGFKVLVVFEEVLHLLKRNPRQVRIVGDVRVALGELWHGHG